MRYLGFDGTYIFDIDLINCILAEYHETTPEHYYHPSVNESLTRNISNYIDKMNNPRYNFTNDFFNFLMNECFKRDIGINIIEESVKNYTRQTTLYTNRSYLMKISNIAIFYATEEFSKSDEFSKLLEKMNLNSFKVIFLKINSILKIL